LTLGTGAEREHLVLNYFVLEIMLAGCYIF